MAGFYIKKIIATGSGVTASSVDFTEGLNIVCGPSNTGKSIILRCIDFMFGGSKTPFDESTGYDMVKMEIGSKDSDGIRLERQIGKNTIYVTSHVPGIDSGKYNAKSGKNRISNLWLSLIGIDDEYRVISNQYFKTQTLTWRTFLHFFLIDDKTVYQEESVLSNAGYYERTTSLSALLFLITGKDYGEFTAQDAPDIKKAKKKAKSDYINEKLQELTERHGKIADSMAPLEGVNIEAEMQTVIDRISETERSIISATNRSRKLLEQIYNISAKLEEGDFLHDRYTALESQYLSDIKRLRFIEDAAEHVIDKPTGTITRCPVCDSELSDTDHAAYRHSKEEIAVITAKLNDLREVITEVSGDRLGLERQLGELKAENDGVLSLIREQLEPQAAELKAKLRDYRTVIQMKQEMSVIKALSEGMNADLGTMEQDSESELRYKPKDHFSSDFMETMGEYLSEMLELCNFERFLTARFSIEDFDVVTNGRKKETEGSGFRAFLNTVLSFSFLRYLSQYGKYTPGLLVIDSPILSLKEKDKSEQPTDTMKSSLFRYFIEHQQYGQVILLENDIPDIDYGKANVTRFTMDDNDGRYGFLLDVRN